jgi:hypothetical protein
MNIIIMNLSRVVRRYEDEEPFEPSRSLIEIVLASLILLSFALTEFIQLISYARVTSRRFSPSGRRNFYQHPECAGSCPSKKSMHFENKG